MAKLARLLTTDRASADESLRLPRLRTRFYAFLSYSHRDKELADWLHRELEKFRVPKALAGKLTANGVVPRRLVPIFRDQHDLSAGGDLAGEIKAALAASQFLIVLCSPTAATSRWTNQEIESFKRTRPEGCVLAAVLAGEPFASDVRGREHEECFPPALRYKFDRRGHQTQKRADPLAADFRATGEGKRLAFLKLVAGMLGVGLDELVQREQLRRQRRLAFLAAASLGGMAITSALAITAIEARNTAREQRRQAEGLVAFMVGDLRDKLEPIGKLDVLDGVGSRVLNYYKNQDTADLSDDALLQRSRALSLLGKVAFNRGNLKQADGLFRQALAGTAESVRRSPEDPPRIFEHAQNMFWVGEVARFDGRPTQAEAAYREYKELADKMAAIQPDNLKYRMEVIYAQEDLGISIFDQHRFDEAQRLFASAEDPMEKLISLYRTDITYQKEFTTLLAWIADAQRAGSDFRGAIATRTRQVRVLEQLLAGSSDSDGLSSLMIAHMGLAILLGETGQGERSLEEWRSAIDLADNLIRLEPRNVRWKSLAGEAHLQLGQFLLSLGKQREAATEAATGCALGASVPKGDTGAKTRVGTKCALLQARVALAAGALQSAMAQARDALRRASSGHSEDPIADRYRTAQVYLVMGDIHAKSGSIGEAKAAWTAALKELPAHVPERPSEMNERYQLLQRLGANSDAAELQARLRSVGFHSIV